MPDLGHSKANLAKVSHYLPDGFNAASAAPTKLGNVPAAEIKTASGETYYVAHGSGFARSAAVKEYVDMGHAEKGFGGEIIDGNNSFLVKQGSDAEKALRAGAIGTGMMIRQGNPLALETRIDRGAANSPANLGSML
jgi:hypothetical protein